jgi:hypothetical protein
LLNSLGHVVMLQNLRSCCLVSVDPWGRWLPAISFVPWKGSQSTYSKGTGAGQGPLAKLCVDEESLYFPFLDHCSWIRPHLWSSSGHL